MSRWALLLFLAATVLLGLPNGAARAQGTTSAITGKVVDENGNPLPGVNIVAVHTPTGTRYGAATNKNGRYTILNMRVGGPYTVRASFVGYQTVRRTGITLDLSETRTINFDLQPRTKKMEEVRVIGRRDAVISQNRTGASINVTQEQIEELPAITRSLTDYARLIPQYSGGGSFGGMNDRYNAIQIDGATLDDVFGLGEAVPGSQAGTQPISLDAIKEFNINISPFDVTQSGFTGGAINAITKSGTNKLKGSVRYLGRSEQFTGDLNGVGTNDYGEQYFVGTLGGPIVKDELFFFVNGEVVLENNPLNAAVGRGPGINNYAVPEGVLNQYGYDSSQEVFNTISSIAQNRYNYNPGGIGPVTQDQNSYKFLAKLDWNISDRHRLTLRHNYVYALDDQGLSRGSQSYGFANRQYQFLSVQNSTVLSLNSTFGSNMFNEFRAVYTRIRDERQVPGNGFPDVEIEFNSSNEINLGVDRFSQANRLNQDLFEITDNFTYTFGDHTLKAGTSTKIWHFENLFIQDYWGSYEFNTLELPNGNTISAIEAFRRGQPIEYRYSYATKAAGTNKPIAEFTAFQPSAYLQDEWQALDNLRLTLGIRVDVPIIPDEPTFNPTAYEAFGKSTADVASGNPFWSPRLGFNYGNTLVNDNLTTQVRGGVGLFAGNPPYVWISNQYSNTGADFNRVDARFGAGAFYPGNPDGGLPGVRLMPTSSGTNPTQQPKPGQNPLLSPVPTTEINVMSDDFKYPQVLKTNLAIDQELPADFTVTLEGLYSNTVNGVTFSNINLRQSGTSKYGRPIYGNTVSQQFTNALKLKNTSKGYSYSGTIQLQRRVQDGISGSIAYTYTQNKKVNSGTSSRAISNWQYNETFDINSPNLGRSDYLVEHRIIANATYRFSYLDRFATSIGVIYEGRSGYPFSWIYSGDANSDGTGVENDLVYVPAQKTDVVLTSGNWEMMNAFIESEEGLDKYRGTYAERNSATAPWQNRLDLQVKQYITTVAGQKLELIAKMENVLNFLNDDWGRIRTISFNNAIAWSFDRYVQPSDVGTRLGGRIMTQDDVGKPVVSFDKQEVVESLKNKRTELQDIASRWQMQIGLRYTF